MQFFCEGWETDSTIFDWGLLLILIYVHSCIIGIFFFFNLFEGKKERKEMGKKLSISQVLWYAFLHFLKFDLVFTWKSHKLTNNIITTAFSFLFFKPHVIPHASWNFSFHHEQSSMMNTQSYAPTYYLIYVLSRYGHFF